MSIIIETSRLQLLPFTSSDTTIFHKLNVDPFIRKYLWDDELISEQLAKEVMAENTRLFSEKHYGLWKIIFKEREKLMGYTGLWFFFAELQPQLIYAILEKYTGLGFATEAAKAIIEYSFQKLDFNYLIAATDEPHLASQHVAKRLGMRFVEKRIEHEKPTLFYRIEKK